ncbi:MAG: hypothetical protein WBF58_08225 [Xanthobacteraceae bacterium]
MLMKKSATDYKACTRTGRAITRSIAGVVVFSAVMAGGCALAAGAPDDGLTIITCTNPYSGASWRIRIDYSRRTVDSNPAEIDDARIAWQDGKTGRKYLLDRRSGSLTVTFASATGGNFLYDRCKLDR